VGSDEEDFKEAGGENPPTEQQPIASKTEGSVSIPLNSVTNLITLHLNGLVKGKFVFRIMGKRIRAVIPDIADYYIINYFGNSKLR
jgi:hypothetical protein